LSFFEKLKLPGAAAQQNRSVGAQIS